MKKEKEPAATAPVETAENTETAIAVASNGAVAAPINMMEDADGGFEHVSGSDMAVPFITVLQKGSPQVDDASTKRIEGAVAGMFMNNVTGDLFPGKDGLVVIPCGFDQKLVEWKPRDSGGGLVGHRKPDDPIFKQCKRNEKNQIQAPNGNLIIDTSYHYLVVERPDGSYFWAILGMSSSQKKTSRAWIFTMKSIIMEQGGKKFNPPMWSHRYKLTTIPQSKDNYTWWGIKIENLGALNVADPAEAEMYMACKAFAKLIVEGAVQVSAPPQDYEADDQNGTDEKVPF